MGDNLKTVRKELSIVHHSACDANKQRGNGTRNKLLQRISLTLMVLCNWILDFLTGRP
jgi:hypothetical protein